MINPLELRLGNKVFYTVNGDKKHIGEITQIARTEDGIKATIDYHYPLSFGDPIPLTPEILEKCGFVGKYKSCGYSYQKNIIHLSSQDEDDNGKPIENYVLHFYDDYKGKPIYYLHELQNLYFARVGEELNYTP